MAASRWGDSSAMLRPVTDSAAARQAKPKAGNGKIHVVITADSNDYMTWQMRVAYYWYKKVWNGGVFKIRRTQRSLRESSESGENPAKLERIQRIWRESSESGENPANLEWPMQAGAAQSGSEQIRR